MAQNRTTPGVRVGRFHVTVSHDRPGVLLARVSFDDASGKQDFETEFEGAPKTARTCSHLVEKHVVAEIATQLTLQMARGLRDPPRGPACSQSKSLPATEPLPCPESLYSVWPHEPPMRGPPPDPPKPPERWPVAVRLGVAVWPELIVAGWGSLGLSAEAGVHYKAISVGVEAHGDPPLGSATFQNLGDVSFARVSGALLLCAHFGWFAGCGVGDAGRFLFPNRIQGLPASVFYGAAGVRVGLEFPVAPPRIFVRAALDLRAPIHPASYTVHGATLFEAAGPSVGLGLGLFAELPP